MKKSNECPKVCFKGDTKKGSLIISYFMSFDGVTNPCKRSGISYSLFYAVNKNNEIDSFYSQPTGYELLKSIPEEKS